MNALPERIAMRTTMFLDFAKGGASQTQRNDEHGVTCIASRSNRGSPFFETWIADRMPGRTFPSYRALRLASEEL